MILPVTPSLRLDGRRAIVTGAGRGIGLAAAAALGQAGAEVTLVSRTASEVEEAAAMIGPTATAAVLDVSDIRAVKAFFADRPAFNILVNNAGTNRPKPMWDVSEEDYHAVYDLNVKSAFFVAQACVQNMIAQIRMPEAQQRFGQCLGGHRCGCSSRRPPSTWSRSRCPRNSN